MKRIRVEQSGDRAEVDRVDRVGGRSCGGHAGAEIGAIGVIGVIGVIGATREDETSAIRLKTRRVRSEWYKLNQNQHCVAALTFRRVAAARMASVVDRAWFPIRPRRSLPTTVALANEPLHEVSCGC